MTAAADLLAPIETALRQFTAAQLLESATALFGALGYRSLRTLPKQSGNPAAFLQVFHAADKLSLTKAQTAEWAAAYYVFQLTSAEVTNTAQARRLFERDFTVNGTTIEAYNVVALHLAGASYSRSALAAITREVNKLFGGPVMVLFAYAQCLTLAVIHRRLHKRDAAKDVLEKVTLIKDIRTGGSTLPPHRAHLDILRDLALPSLQANPGFTNWVELHNAWQQTLDSSELNKRFFREIANWYFWAQTRVTFPAAAGPTAEERNATSLIRLLTRLIFIWFLKEKDLVPDDLFQADKISALLKDFAPGGKGTVYYKAILQNLFFATLNTEMPDRAWKTADRGGHNQQYMVHNVYRYKDYFRQPDTALQQFANIPFLNGGLFECLDKSETERVDGFSTRADNPLTLPDDLFFGRERDVDLNETYGTKGKKYKVRGLLETLAHYKFTVDENTPIEEEVALDPELLGRVFENLLAAYNPETGVTARKQTGSFYTPREIVAYMVDESLLAYFESALQQAEGSGQKAAAAQPLAARLRHLFAYTAEPHQFTPAEVEALITAIDRLKILDPACGSGAFPMGILHRLVFLLGKLDPGNARWKEQQIEKVNAITEATVREKTLEDVEEAFNRNALDYGRKLYLIENTIYGVDIQPIAVQIAKLRCFISLIVDQRTDNQRPNRGVRALPNLETKFVAANTLIGLARPKQLQLRNPAIDTLEKELAQVRHDHFSARTHKRKEAFRAKDAKIRAQLRDLLKKDGWPVTAADQLAAWDPYNQNASAPFFDVEWMFGIKDGFDIAIGNPPYIRSNNMDKRLKEHWQTSGEFETITGKFDVYVLFIERAIKLLKESGALAFIVPYPVLSQNYAMLVRKYILEKCRIESIYDVSELKVFDATVATCVLVLRREMNNNARLENVISARKSTTDYSQISEWKIPQKVFWGTFQNMYRLNAILGADKISERMWSMSKPFSEYCYIGIGIDVHDSKTGLDKSARIYDKPKGKHFKPYVEGKEISRYAPPAWNRYLEYIPEKMHRPKYPEMFENEKVLVQVVVGREGIIATLDRENLYAEQTLSVCLPKYILAPTGKKDTEATDEQIRLSKKHKLPYLLGLLCSKLINWYFQIWLSDELHVVPENLRQLPMRTIDFTKESEKELHDDIVKIVNQIYKERHDNPKTDTSYLEREIDALVYQLYGLTADEIRVVEGG